MHNDSPNAPKPAGAPKDPAANKTKAAPPGEKLTLAVETNKKRSDLPFRVRPLDF